MYFKNYKYFLAIVEYGGVTRAAEALFLSQPSLSKYLRRLEQNLGIELFDHSSSPLKLTYAGQRYYEYIKRFESLERQFDDELGSIRDDDSGETRMGIAQWRGSILLPTLIPRFHEVYPHVEINIVEGRAMQIETALVQGRVDLCLMNLPSHFPAQTNQEILWNEKCLLVGNRNHSVIQKALQTRGRLPQHRHPLFGAGALHLLNAGAEYDLGNGAPLRRQQPDAQEHLADGESVHRLKYGVRDHVLHHDARGRCAGEVPAR